MTPQIAIVIFLLIASVVVFALEWLTVDLVGLSVIAILMIAGILAPEQAFSGFSNPVIMMISGLMVISGALYHSGITDTIGRMIYQFSGRSESRLLVFVMAAQIAVSGFMNNVAATAMFLPGITALAKKAKVHASKLLIPLAYASMLGGTCTLIGTSTNMAVNAMLHTYGIEPFHFFSYAPIGISISIFGILFVLLTSRWTLPAHPDEELEYTREYTTEIVVLPNSNLVGKSIAQSGLGRMDLLVLGIHRKEETIIVPSPLDRIHAEDLLLIQGKAEDILKIKQRNDLKIREDVREKYEFPVTNLVEVELAPRSLFIGKSLKQMNFRQRYGLSVIAIYRRHETVLQKIGLIPLLFGDVLLIQGPESRTDQLKQDRNFIFLNDVAYRSPQASQGGLALLIFGLVVLAGSIGLFPISAVAFLGALAMILFRILPLKDAYGSLEWPLLILIAGMLSLGKAMESTGAAEYLAQRILSLQESPSPQFLLAAFFILTVILTQPLSNAAAALVVLPIALHVAIQQGVNPHTFAMTVSVAASCSFLTPFEPACALVYNPGKYRVRDFFRAGIGLTAIVFVVSMILIPLLWPL